MRRVGPVSLAQYSCYSAAGAGVKAYWDGLVQGQDFGKNGVCPFPGTELCELNDLDRAFDWIWKDLVEQGAKENLKGKVGVILSSTKGALTGTLEPVFEKSPLSFLLERWVARTGLSPIESLCVSQACTSSHAATLMAAQWLDAGRVDSVLVIAADGIGRFVRSGFHCLRALAHEKVTPFAEVRLGLQLGSAVAALVLKKSGPLTISQTAVEADGHSVTRPDPKGEVLAKLCQQVMDGEIPDLILAHATGTVPNDAVEALVFEKLYQTGPGITCTKWSVGHTLGASGLMDTIAAAECLTRQKTFSIANTLNTPFPGNFLIRGRNLSKPLRQVLVTSLGFGGTYGALQLRLLGERA